MEMALNRRNIVFAGFAAAVFAGGLTSFAEAKTKLVYAGYTTEKSISTQLDKWFMDEVEKRSNGDLYFERYYAGALLGAPDIFPGIGRGAVDFGTGAPQAYNPKQYPISNVVLPWITERADAVAFAFRELYKTNAALKNEFSSQGVKFLWAAPFPDGGIFSNFPIAKPNDLAGKRIRSVAAIAWGIEAAGGSPVPMGFADGVEAISRKALDGMANAPFDSAISLGLHKVVSNLSDAGRLGINSVSLTAMNQASFARLTKEQQEIVVQVASEVPDRFVVLANDAVEDAVKKFAEEQKGVDVKVSTDEEAKVWRDMMTPLMRNKFIETVSAVTTDGGQIYDQFVELVRKYEPESKYTPALVKYKQMSSN